MKLTPEMLHRIQEVLDRHHAAVAVDVFGESTLPPDALKELQDLGLIEGMDLELLSQAHRYGRHIASHPEDAGKSFEALRTSLRDIPLSRPEEHALQLSQTQAGKYLTSIGAGADKDTYQALVRNATADKILTRQGAKSFVSELGHLTQDWSRNLDRVAITEAHNAHQGGLAADLADGGKDPWVSVVPQSNACKHCLRLHLGPDGAPRIVRLSSLAPAGANVGRKVADWVACVGSIHPHCQCVIQHMPEGWGWTEDGIMMPGADYGVKYGSAGEMQKAIQLEDEYRDDLCKAYQLEGKISYQGLPIAIETGAGNQRFWHDYQADEEGATIMAWPYGYVEGTKATDGDDVDVYVGPNPYATSVYIVHQRKKQRDGSFRGYDEVKCMLGFSSPAEAKHAYMLHYDNPGFFGSLESMPMSTFKTWVYSKAPAQSQPGRTKRKSSVKFVMPALGGDLNLRKSLDGRFLSQVGGTGKTNDGGLSTMEGAGGGVNLQVKAPDKPINLTDVAGVRKFFMMVPAENEPTVRLDRKGYEGMDAKPEGWKWAIADAEGNYKITIRGENADDPDSIKNNMDNIKRQAAQIAASPVNRIELHAPRTGPLENPGRDFRPESRWGNDMDELIKSFVAKYTRRVLTGKTDPKYKYTYAVNSSYHGHPPKVGHRIKLTHKGVEGHFTVTHEHKEGHVTVKHTKTGDTLDLTREGLSDMFWNEHADGEDLVASANDKLPLSVSGLYGVYQTILDEVGVHDHDSEGADRAYLAFRQGKGKKPKEWEGGELDGLQRGRTKKQKKLTSAFHGFEKNVHKLKIKTWKDLAPVLEMLREVPDFDAVQIPQDRAITHFEEEDAKRQREGMTLADAKHRPSKAPAKPTPAPEYDDDEDEDDDPFDF